MAEVAEEPRPHSVYASCDWYMRRRHTGRQQSVTQFHRTKGGPHAHELPQLRVQLPAAAPRRASLDEVVEQRHAVVLEHGVHAQDVTKMHWSQPLQAYLVFARTLYT